MPNHKKGYSARDYVKNIEDHIKYCSSPPSSGPEVSVGLPASQRPKTSHEWIEARMDDLKRSYPHRTIVVVDRSIVKIVDGIWDIIAMNQYIKRYFPGQDWSYSYLDPEPLEWLS